MTKVWRGVVLGVAMIATSIGVPVASGADTVTYSSGFGSLACPISSTCYASLYKNAGGANNQHSEVATTTAVATTGFHAVTAPSLGQPGETGALTCGAQKHCLDALSTGIAKTVNGGLSWTTSPTPANVVFSAVACRGESLCLAGGYDADHSTVALYRSTNFGASWTASRLPSLPHASGETASILSCATNTLCMAQLSDDVLSSTNGGASWTTVTLPTGLRMQSLSCSGISAPYQCVAGLVGATRMYFARTTNLGATWSTVAVGPAGGSDSLTPSALAVGCYKNLCVLGGQRVGATTSGLLFRSVNAGSSFIQVGLSSGVTSVPVVCVASPSVALAGVQLGVEPTKASLLRTIDQGAHFTTVSFPAALVS